MATMHIPALLRPLAGGAETVRCSGSILREVIDDLDRQHAGLRDRILEGGALRAEIAIAIGGSEVPGLDAVVTDDADVHIIPAIAGGRL